MSNSEGDRWLEKARKHLTSDFDRASKYGIKALSYFEEKVKQNPDDKESWLKLAEIYSNFVLPEKTGKQFKKIAQCYLAALRDVDLLKEMGHAYLNLSTEENEKQNLEKAKVCFLLYLEKRQRDPAVLTSLGNCYQYLADFEGARKWYEKALDQDPRYYRALTRMGLLYSKLGDFKRSIEFFRKAAEAEPKSHHPWSNMARIYFRRATGLEITPHSIIVRVSSKRYRRFFNEAIRCLEKAIDRSPKSWGLWQELEFYYAIMGDYKMANKCHTKVQKIKGDKISEES